jgi:hypothetical protein
LDFSQLGSNHSDPVKWDPVIRYSVVGISLIWDLVRVKILILVIEQNSTSFAVITDATVATVSNSYNNTWTKKGYL